MPKSALMVTHPHRQHALESADFVGNQLAAAGFKIFTPQTYSDTQVDLVVVLGGDGSILQAAEITRDHPAPILGVNFGHVGFLAETDTAALDEVIARVIAADYSVDQRMTVDVTIRYEDTVIQAWAINEVSVEKGGQLRAVEVAMGVDGQGISSFSADGVVVATPTGSTAYAFSGGGPVVWPDVEALLVVPLAAHALFARPMVVGPDSHFAVEVLPRNRDHAVVWCDGRRSYPVPPGARVDVVRGLNPVPLVRLNDAPFSDRLVRKFNLPVAGWRGGAEA